MFQVEQTGCFSLMNMNPHSNLNPTLPAAVFFSRLFLRRLPQVEGNPLSSSVTLVVSERTQLHQRCEPADLPPSLRDFNVKVSYCTRRVKAREQGGSVMCIFIHKALAVSCFYSPSFHRFHFAQPVIGFVKLLLFLHLLYSMISVFCL